MEFFSTYGVQHLRNVFSTIHTLIDSRVRLTIANIFVRSLPPDARGILGRRIIHYFLNSDNHKMMVFV